MKFIHERRELAVDINEYPEVLDSKAGEVTIGDLHGNALYLLNTLLRLKAVTLSKENYEQFKALYYKQGNDWQDADFAALNKILDSFQVYDHRKIRFLGDLLADRGRNDFLTLKLLEMLDKGGADYTITLSNHDMEFISYLEQTNLFHDSYEPTLASTETYARSLLNFRKLMSSKSLSAETKKQHLSPIKLKSIIKKCLFRHYKAIDYNFAGEWNTHGLAIYTHAAVDINLIEQMAKELGAPFDKTNTITLAKSIDAINEIIAQQLNSGNLIHLFPELFPSTNTKRVDTSKKGAKALSRLLWNRDISDLDFKLAPLATYFVHGHDKKSIAQGVYTLDNDLGSSDELTKGTMSLWITDIQGLNNAMTVETFYKARKENQYTFCIDQYRQQARFQVRAHDSETGKHLLEVPLPSDIDFQEAQRRLKKLYRYRSELSQAEALLIASPIFDYEVDRLAAGSSPSNIITPEPF